MIPLLLLLATSCPPWAPTNTSTAACTALDDCIARVIAAGDADTDATGPEREHVLVAARLERCAWSAYTERDGARAQAAVLRPIRLCPTPDAVTCPVCEERPRYVDALSHGGACVACAGLSALGGWAACRGGL
jgi:hypothetical protein